MREFKLLRVFKLLCEFKLLREFKNYLSLSHFMRKKSKRLIGFKVRELLYCEEYEALLSDSWITHTTDVPSPDAGLAIGHGSQIQKILSLK